MTLHLLQRDRGGADNLAKSLQLAVANLGLCKKCHTLTEYELCNICASPKRDEMLVCVVESLADVWVISQVTDYKGILFVLNGRLSPLNGIGPDEIGLTVLEQ